MNDIKKEDVFIKKASEDTKCVALGEEGPSVETVEVAVPPQSLDERVSSVEQRINQIALSLDSIHSIMKRLRDKANARKDYAIAQSIEKVKSDMKIPEGTVLIGITRGVPYYCEVKNGAFYVGITQYSTLSAAAEGVSGVRRSGWTFWKMSGGKHNGKSMKDIFR